MSDNLALTAVDELARLGRLSDATAEAVAEALAPSESESKSDDAEDGDTSDADKDSPVKSIAAKSGTTKRGS